MLGVVDQSDRDGRPTRSCKTWPRRWASARRSPPRRSVCSSGSPGDRVADPFFGGDGPERTACTECGSLHDRVPGGCQEHAGQELPASGRASRRDGSSADDGARDPFDRDGYGGCHRRTGAKDGVVGEKSIFTADQVVVAAGTYGTQRLLLAMKESGALPELSDTLGTVVRTNSEAVLAATARSRVDRTSRRA